MYEDVIAQVPLFSDLTQREQSVLAANCRERDYPEGATLLRQGETGVGLFIITSGRAQVTQQTPDGSTRDLGVGSSRVDLQACKLEYSIVSPK